MNSKRKLIFGIIAIVLGILSLFLGMILFIRSTGIDALFYTSVRELRLTFFLGLLFISWGLGWLITGIVFLVFGLRNFSFDSRKPLVIGIALLVVFSVLSGGVLVAVSPPSPSVTLSVRDSRNYTEAGSSVSFPAYVNVTTSRAADMNISYISSSVVHIGSCSIAYGTHELVVPLSGFSLPAGKGKLEFEVVSLSVSKIVYVNYTVYPSLSANFSGPTSVNDANGPVCVVYSSTYKGYAPDNYTWNPGAFYVGNVQEISYNPYSQDLHVTFFLNKSVSDPFGYNYTLYISLTVSNIFGESYSMGGYGYDPISITGQN